MLAIKTAETDFTIGPPLGQEDEIGSLPARRDYGTIYSVWEPTDEERQAIANGHNVRLGVAWIGAFPPVSVGVTPLQKVDQ